MKDKGEFQQVPQKILRIAIWLNGLLAISLVASLFVLLTTELSPHRQYITRTVEQFLILCVFLFPVLGISMPLMEILSRRDRDNLVSLITRREFRRGRMKILKAAVWLNGLVAASLALSLLLVWITAPYQQGPYIQSVVVQVSIACMILFTILGICMLVTETLSRKDSDSLT